MKQHSTKYQLEGASVFALILLFIVLLTSILSFTTKKYAADFWSELGLSQKQGDQSISQSFLQGYLYNYGARSAKNIMAGNRGAVTKDLLTYTKQFVNSDAFKKDYENTRLASKPREPLKKTPRTKEEIRKQMIEDTKKSIAEIEKNMASYTGDFKKSMQEVVDAQKEQVKEYAKPDNQMIDLMAQGEKMTVDNDLANYQKELTKWEQDFPASHTVFIKRRLQQYIEIANTVDFSAQLKEVGDKKKFVNPAYEAKNNDWKKVFRAGKEVNDVAKPFAAAWIKEL